MVLLKDRRILFATLTALLTTTAEYILAPILSLRVDDYDIPESTVGLFYSAEATTYVIGTCILSYGLPKWLPHRVTIIISIFLIAVSFALIGPPFSALNLQSMIIGLLSMGLVMSSAVMPLMPEMLQASRVAFP